ncbi:helix-turn-helix domain-containing protein [Ruegeria atlantica]|uniref:Virulence-regulating protein VirS n=1 Tax=Ruegeria atlantica TaxID=81569 RepID=A0A0P1E4B5_9RHOB|nr:AraC family transcriptional regulator [Ruegeria atlantica]CUH41819.1 Virulence-regulating protein VirS [Ruegeria atlantica]
MNNDRLITGPDARSSMSTLPLVRLISAHPILEEMDKRGLPSDEVLDSVGLNREAMLDTGTFVHAMVMYQFLEAAADASGERDFCAGIGENLDLSKWYPTVDVAKTASTIGDLLTAWVVSATKHSSAIQQRLDVHGAMAIISGHRSFKLSLTPAQVDGFHVGFLISILRHAMGPDWKPSEVLVTVSEPKALPRIFHGIHAVKGDRQGHKIRFPAQWLARQFDEADFLRRALLEKESQNPAKSIVSSIKQALRPHIGEPDLSGPKMALICGMNYRIMMRVLAFEGTNLTQLTNDLKCEIAVEALAQEETSISDIAGQLGYSDSTSFTRAFRKWTGFSPTKYRKWKL